MRKNVEKIVSEKTGKKATANLKEAFKVKTTSNLKEAFKVKTTSNLKEAFKVASLPVIFASLCCLSPVILVLFGLSTVSFAASLADTLYGQYRWLFRLAGLLSLSVSIYFYFRRKNLCTFNEAKKRRNEIINFVMLALIVGIVGYVVYLYVILHYIGVWLNIWK